MHCRATTSSPLSFTYEGVAGKQRRVAKPVVVAGGMFLLIVVFYVLREHWSHVIGAWPHLLLFLCPLMHLFMQRG
jgi:hypothetical protein